MFEKESNGIVSFNTGLHKFLIDLADNNIIKTFGVVYTSFNQLRITVLMHDDNMFDEIFNYEGDSQ